MSSPQHIILANVTASGDGVSAGLDIGAGRSVARFTLDVTAATGPLVVTVETSRDEVTWRAVGTFPEASAPAVLELALGGLERFVRASWTTATSATFALEGDAHQVYATARDVVRYGLPERALSGIPAEDVVAQLLAASALADGPLAAAGFLLPLLAWGDDLREAVAVIAAEGCLVQRGFSPTGDDQTIVDRASRRRTWLSNIGDGGVLSPATVGTPPAVVPAGGVVVSRPRRGW